MLIWCIRALNSVGVVTLVKHNYKSLKHLWISSKPQLPNEVILILHWVLSIIGDRDT
jgi:hypothetical protein